MREAIGGTWIFQIVIFFILLFTGYMCLSINHSKAFNVKNEIVTAIERDEGLNDDSMERIVNYLKTTSYRTTGRCKEGLTGYDREGNPSSGNSAFCVGIVPVRGDATELPGMKYYRVQVFYQLDLPIFKSIFEFTITGDTRVISESTKELQR